ncbi:MAG: hypothetical protein D6784_02735, partial [Chloroflexi bacterium]
MRSPGKIPLFLGIGLLSAGLLCLVLSGLLLAGWLRPTGTDRAANITPTRRLPTFTPTATPTPLPTPTPRPSATA